MRHAEAHVRALSILETKHFVANCVPTTRLLPDLSRMKRREVKFLAADGVHLFTQDLHDLKRHSLAQRQQRINSSRQLPDETGAQQKFVRDNFGIGRVFTQSRDKVS